MGEFSDNLRREREARGVSIEDIALGTRIGRHHLEALETGELERLPGGAFNRGFVRAYARFLGMDPEVTLTDYLQEEKAQGLAPPASNQDVLREMARLADLRGGQAEERAAPRLVKRRLAWAAAGLFILAMAWMARGWVFDGQPDESSVAPSGQTVDGAHEPATLAQEPPVVMQAADSTSTTLPASRAAAPPEATASSPEPTSRQTERSGMASEAGPPPTSPSPSSAVASAPARPAPPPTSTTAAATAPPRAEPAAGRETAASSRPQPPARAATPGRAPAISGIKVSDYGVGAGISGKLLTGKGSRFPEGKPVWFWTHLLGARPGEVVEHVWMRDGAEVAKVSLTIGSSNWRAYSKKTMYAGSSGTWVVMARTPGGEILALSEFTCD